MLAGTIIWMSVLGVLVGQVMTDWSMVSIISHSGLALCFIGMSLTITSSWGAADFDGRVRGGIVLAIGVITLTVGVILLGSTAAIWPESPLMVVMAENVPLVLVLVGLFTVNVLIRFKPWLYISDAYERGWLIDTHGESGEFHGRVQRVLVAVVVFLVGLVLLGGAYQVTRINTLQTLNDMRVDEIQFEVKRVIVKAVEIDQTAPLTITVGDDKRAHEAVLTCGIYKDIQLVDNGQVTFDEVPGDGCRLSLNRESDPYAPIYRGDTLECRVVRGRTECEGGLADVNLARLHVSSTAPATLILDGRDHGRLPIENLRMKPGAQALQIMLMDGRTRRFALNTVPNEVVTLHVNVAGYEDLDNLTNSGTPEVVADVEELPRPEEDARSYASTNDEAP